MKHFNGNKLYFICNSISLFDSLTYLYSLPLSLPPSLFLSRRLVLSLSRVLLGSGSLDTGLVTLATGHTTSVLSTSLTWRSSGR